MFSLFTGWEIHHVPGVMRITEPTGLHREISFTIQTRKRRLRRAKLINQVAMHCQDLARNFNGDVLEIRLRWGSMLDGYSRIVVKNLEPIQCVVYNVPGENTRFHDIASMGSDLLVWKC